MKSKTSELENWRAVEDVLPPINERVYVRGNYVAPDTGYPIAYRRAARVHPAGNGAENWRWESTEWRGSVAITHWHTIPIVKP